MKKIKIVLFVLLLSIMESMGCIDAKNVNVSCKNTEQNSLANCYLVQDLNKNNNNKSNNSLKSSTISIDDNIVTFLDSAFNVRDIVIGDEVTAVGTTEVISLGSLVSQTPTVSSINSTSTPLSNQKNSIKTSSMAIQSKKKSTSSGAASMHASSLDLKSSQQNSNRQSKGALPIKASSKLRSSSYALGFISKEIIIHYGSGQISIVVPPISHSSSSMSFNSSSRRSHHYQGSSQSITAVSKHASSSMTSSSNVTISKKKPVSKQTSAIQLNSSSQVGSAKVPVTKSSKNSAHSASKSVESVKSCSVTVISKPSLHDDVIIVLPEGGSYTISPAVSTTGEQHSKRHKGSAITKLSKTGFSTTEVKISSPHHQSEHYSSQVIVDQKGNLHLSKQQIQALKKRFYSSNPEIAKVVNEAKQAIVQANSRHLLVTSAQERNFAESHRTRVQLRPNAHQVKLPIKGILPATRMDSHTWVYSLIGLGVMIVSGMAFFSKKHK